MADDKKPDPPLDKPKVKVTVAPVTHPVRNAPPEEVDDNHRQNRENEQYAKKIKENLTDQVKKAIERAAPQGGEKQFEAAEKTADAASRQINEGKIDKIKVHVADGQRERTTEHMPNESSSD